MSPALANRFFTTEPPGKPLNPMLLSSDFSADAFCLLRKKQVSSQRSKSFVSIDIPEQSNTTPKEVVRRGPVIRVGV